MRGPERSTRRGLGCLFAGLTGFGAGGLGLVLLVGAALSGIGLTFEGCDLDLSGLEDMGNPGTGRDSQRVDVAVEPTEGLVDGSTVFVTSEAFAPHQVVSIGLCLEEAATEREGSEACDTDGGQRFAVDAEGTLTAVVAVPRVITVGGEAHDCAAAPERCLLVAADASDYDVSGGEPLAFAPGLPPADLTPREGGRAPTLLLPATLDPSTPLAPGTEITATVSGLVPGEPVIAGLCTEDFLQNDLTACEPLGDDALAALLGRSVEEVDRHADATGAITYTATAPGTIAPFTGGPVDCTTEAGRCALVVGAAADPQRSAYLPLVVRP